MITVSNSSPLILYATIGYLHLLSDLFFEILIPPRVWNEMVDEGAHRPGSQALSRASSIRQHAPQNTTLITSLMSDLDPGETRAIALWIEVRLPAQLLLDDRKARRIPREHRISVLGSASMLVAAKQRSLITRVAPIQAELRGAGLYLDDVIARGLLTRVRESSASE